MSKLMVSVSGIRGIVGETLTPDIIIRYAAAFAQLIGKGTIIVARDSRVSGDMVESLVAGVLLSMGCKVITLGIVPTPTAEIMTLQKKANGGIIITASHNPPEWNALKFINSSGMFLGSGDVTKLQDLTNTNLNAHIAPWNKVHSIIKENSSISVHREKLLSLPFIDIPAIKARKFKVILDSNHGAGGIMGKELLEQLGCIVIPIGEEPNGQFLHPCEPVPDNLESVCKKVKDTGADVGFAIDPDSDRMAIISEKGVAIGEEYTLAIATKCMLERKKGPVTLNLSTSRMSEEIAESYGVKCFRTPVGEINVSSAMKKNGSVIGGEGNGGAIIPDVLYGRDAFGGMVLTLQHLIDTKKSVSEAISALPSYVMVKERIELNKIDPDIMIRRIEEQLSGGEKNREDGLRIAWSDSWIHIRKSNTEPILRIIIETRSNASTQELSEKITTIIRSV